MLVVSDLFKQYVQSSERQFETRAIIDGVEYNSSAIIDCEIEGDLAPDGELTIGEVLVRQLSLQIKTRNTLPENASAIIQTRLNGLSGWTEWVQLGVFYIDSRKIVNEVLELKCFDKLICANQKFVSALTYPANMVDVLNEIATILGVQIDAGVVIDPNFLVPYKDLEANIRDALGYIAASHGRSFRLSREGKLQFVSFKPSVYTSVNASSYFKAIQVNVVKTFTKLKVVYNSEGEFLEVGSGDSNHTMEVYNPYALFDANILNTMFAEINGITYIPFEMDWKGFLYTEIGDGLAIDKLDSSTWLENYDNWSVEDENWAGVYPYNSIVLREKFKLKNSLKCKSDAPSKSAQGSEFKFEGSISQQVKAALKQEAPYYGVVIGKQSGLTISHSSGRSKVTLNSDKIAFEVDGEDVLYFDAVNKKYKFKGEVVIDSTTDLGKRVSFIDGNGVFSGSIDVDDDVFIGDDLFFGGNGLAIRNTYGGFTLERAGTTLLKFYSNVLHNYGDLALYPGKSLGVTVTGGYLSLIKLEQSQISLGGAHSTAIKFVGNKLGFFNNTPIYQPNVAWIKSVVVTQTAGSAYTSNEQNMLNNLKKDVQNLQRVLSELLEAAVDLGLVEYYTWS